jgi:hypothetical protein
MINSVVERIFSDLFCRYCKEQVKTPENKLFKNVFGVAGKI